VEVEMADLILFVLAAYAGWFVFTTAELPLWDPLRDIMMSKSPTFAKFIHCPICSGFWISLALAYVFPLTLASVRWPDATFGAWLLAPLVQAFAGAGAIYLIETHVRRLEER